MPGIQGVSQALAVRTTSFAPSNTVQGNAAGFAKVLGESIRALDNTIKESQQSILGFLAGEDIDIHSVIIAQEKASLALQFAVEVRNKVIEAYQEMMRMQV